MNRTNGTPQVSKLTSCGLTEVQRAYADQAIVAVIAAHESGRLTSLRGKPITVYNLTQALKRLGLPPVGVLARIWEMIGTGELLAEEAWHSYRDEDGYYPQLELELSTTGQAPLLAAASLLNDGSRFPDPFADEEAMP